MQGLRPEDLRRGLPERPSAASPGLHQRRYHQVSKANVVPGDIIQETDSGSHTTGIHTAIVSGDPAGADIRVIDSNFVAPNKVGEHTYNPTTHASSHGGVAYYWHKG